MKITIEVSDVEICNNCIQIDDMLYDGRLLLSDLPQRFRSIQSVFYSAALSGASHSSNLQKYIETLKIIKQDAIELSGTEAGKYADYMWQTHLSCNSFVEDPAFLQYLSEEGIIQNGVDPGDKVNLNNKWVEVADVSAATISVRNPESPLIADDYDANTFYDLLSQNSHNHKYLYSYNDRFDSDQPEVTTSEPSRVPTVTCVWSEHPYIKEEDYSILVFDELTEKADFEWDNDEKLIIKAIIVTCHMAPEA